MNKIYNKDCIVGMKIIPDQTIDLVVTDPPFAIDFKAKKANYNRTASRVLSGYNEIKAKDYYDFTNAWMNQAYRVLKKSGSMYVFSGWNNLKDILTGLDDNGFTTINHIIWKYQFGVVTTKNLLLLIITVFLCVRMIKNENFSPIQDLKKMLRHMMDKVFITRIRKMFGL